MPAKKTNLRKLFDFWSVQNSVVILILKTLRFFRDMGAKAESAGWRRMTGIFVKNEYSKFMLAAFRLKYADHAPETREQAKEILIRRLREFIRRKPRLGWAVRTGTFSFRRERIHIFDIMEAEADSSGNIIRIIPHFDETKPPARFAPAQISFILRGIMDIYNSLRLSSPSNRTVKIERTLKRWAALNAGYDFRLRRRLNRFVDRIMSSVFLFCEFPPGVSDGRQPVRFHMPDLRKVRHPGWGMICIDARFSGDLSEADLWWQYSHVTADGAPMQEIIGQLKSEWGSAGKTVFPALNSTLSSPDIAYCGDQIFRARVCIDFSDLRKCRERINRRWSGEMGGQATLAGMFLWGLAHHPFFANKKFLVPVDLGRENREGELGLLVIRPGKFRKESVSPLRGFLNFHREFNRKMKDIREGRGEITEFLQLCTMLHPFFYHAARFLMPNSIQEILGTVGFSVIRDAEIFISPFTDFQINGFLSLGSIAMPTCNGKEAGSLCICGGKRLIRTHLEAVRLAVNGIPEFFRDNEENQMKKNESDSNFSEKILSVHDNENGGLTL